MTHVCNFELPLSFDRLIDFYSTIFQHTTIYNNNRSKISQFEQDNPKARELISSGVPDAGSYEQYGYQVIVENGI